MARNKWYQKLIALNRDHTVSYTDRDGIQRRVDRDKVKPEDIAHLPAAQRSKLGM